MSWVTQDGIWENVPNVGMVHVTEKEVSILPQHLPRLVSHYGEYSCSLPTGTTAGKRWMRNARAYGRPRVGPEWYLGEYVEGANPDCIDIRWRVVVFDEVRMADDAARRLRGEQTAE